MTQGPDAHRLFQLWPQLGQVDELIDGIAQLPGHHAFGIDQTDLQPMSTKGLDHPLKVAAAAHQPKIINAGRHGHQIEAELHVQAGTGTLTLILVGWDFSQGFGPDCELQADESIAKRAWITEIL
jgi:hypothetical protein